MLWSLALSENIDVYTDWKDSHVAEPEHYEEDHEDEESDGYGDDSEETLD